MSLEWRARSSALAWSNPLAWWWGLLTLVSGVNIAVWFLLYRQLQPPAGGLGGMSGIELMLLLCAGYVFGCAFRSFLPRADVQRICLFDTWLSSVVVGRSVATVAEICFAAQWAIILHQLGTMTGADTTLNAAWVILPLIVIAECFSWYAVLTRHYLGNAIENSIWAVYHGTVVDLAPDPELYRAVAESFPGVVIEDPWLEDGCREALAGAKERLSFDAPVHSLSDLDDLPLEPRWLNVKPSRFGTVRKLLECIEACEKRGISMYGGGQFELGAGRRQIQKVASVFYADGPNDVAPSEYNEGGARPGLPTSPLPAPEGIGF